MVKVSTLLSNKISVIYKIYLIQKPDIFYIGSAISFSDRKIRHRYALGCKRTIDFKLNLSLKKQIKVKDFVSGHIYQSIGIAAASVGEKYSTLYAKLRGRIFNNTNLTFL